MSYGYDEAAKWYSRAAASALVLLIALVLLAQPVAAQSNLGRIIDRWQHRSLDNVPGVYHGRRGGHHLRTLPFYRHGRPQYRKRHVAPRRALKKWRAVRKRRTIRRGGCSWTTIRNSRGTVVYHEKVCW